MGRASLALLALLLPVRVSDVATQSRMIVGRVTDEFGQRWVDLARYGKLLELPRDQPTHRIWPALPFAQTECNFRQAENLTGCPAGGESGI
ncbi:MAG: hypothetical protein HY700_08580 [Gemmatimonadetes bacterium]|nr:hypothetical protein [Gemmatimonadota bacterium]